MLANFLKIEHSRKFWNFKTEKRLQNLYKKENIKPEIKPIMKIYKINFIDQEKNKQKVLDFLLIGDGTSMVKNAPKFLKALERQNMQNQTISEFCVNDNK